MLVSTFFRKFPETRPKFPRNNSYESSILRNLKLLEIFQLIENFDFLRKVNLVKIIVVAVMNFWFKKKFG